MNNKKNLGSRPASAVYTAGRIISVLLLAIIVHAEELELIETKVVDGFYAGVASSKFTTNNTSIDDKLIFGIWRLETNNHAAVYIPTEPEYACQIELFDTNKIAMPKTRIGERVGTKFFALDTTFFNEGAQLRREYPMDKPGVAMSCLFFPTKPGFGGQPTYSPEDLFEIKNPGNYMLQIRFQIIVRTGAGTNRAAHIVRFPPLDYPLVKMDSARPPAETKRTSP